MIPKNIFLFFDTGYESLHPKLKENVEFIKNQNPTYTVKLYDNKLFEEYLNTKGSNYLSYFNSLNKEIGQLLADYFRLVILYFEGGVYMDIKSRPAKPLDDFIQQEDKLWLFWGDEKHFILGSHIETTPIIVEVQNPLIKKHLDNIHYKIDNYEEYSKTLKLSYIRQNLFDFGGPRALAKVLNLNKDIWENNSSYHILNQSYLKDKFIFSFVGGDYRKYRKLYGKPKGAFKNKNLVMLI